MISPAVPPKIIALASCWQAIARDRLACDRRERKQREEGKPFSGANNLRVFSRT